MSCHYFNKLLYKALDSFTGEKFRELIEHFANETFADCQLLPILGVGQPKIKLSRKAAIPRNSQKFSPAKVSGYTVSPGRAPQGVRIKYLAPHKINLEYGINKFNFLLIIIISTR